MNPSGQPSGDPADGAGESEPCAGEGVSTRIRRARARCVQKSGGEGLVTCRAARRDHHLYYEHDRGWMLRVTVDLGARVVGKRMKFRLGTHSLDEAGRGRELVVRILRQLGLTVRLRGKAGRGGALPGEISEQVAREGREGKNH